MKLGKINRQSIGISGFASVLANYEGMPSELYIRGKLPEGRPPTVAIIGSRKPTAYGKQVTEQLAGELAKRGVVIISGLAYGVDAIAHQAALDAGGTTIAVLASGLHKIQPAGNEQLGAAIIAGGGAIISEYEPGIEARPYHFLARNRIVSGLADAVIVTEATDRSGTFSTANHALDQNKEIFAVPGPITSLLSAGPNRLLQQGAHVVRYAQDVLDIIAPALAREQMKFPLGMNPDQTRVLQLLGEQPLATDGLAERMVLPFPKLLQTLTQMEVEGSIRNVTGTWHIRPQ